MPARKPKFKHAIICDDIRQEVGNKISFIGIYGNNISVTKFPYLFPKLCFVNFFKDINKGDSFSIKLTDPSMTQLGDTIVMTAPQNIKSNADFSIFAIYSPIEVKEAGLYKLVISINDDKKTHDIKFAINKTKQN